MKPFIASLLLVAVLSLPCVSALDVNVIYNGQTKGAAQINAEQVINWDVGVERNASDFTWSRVNVHVSAISGDSARPISKLYLYRCKAYKPIDCIMKADIPEPMEFGSYVDADLSWSDISAGGGMLRYPEVANLMLLAKLEGENEAWVGAFIKIERTDYNQFNVPFNYELRSIDVYPTAENLVEPVRTYINNFHMVPMNWVSKVVFPTSGLYALGASKEDFDSQPVSFRPEKPTAEIKQIMKEFYLVFPETVEGISNPVTLNLNPTSQCGDGTCQSNLGESSASCCYDCRCPAGQFCDAPNETSPESGVCKSGNIGLEVSGLFQAPVKGCESEGSTHFTAKITNGPSGLTTKEFSGTLQMEDFTLPVECAGTAASLDCSFEHTTEIVCGGFERPFEATFTLPIEYYNGQNTITTELRTNATGKVRYQCKCEEGAFCDTKENACQEEQSMSLNILETNTPKYSVTAGGAIKMVVQLDYAPPNYTASATRYNIQEILEGEEDTLPGLSGTMNCTKYEDYGEPNAYNCEIKYAISGYDRTLEYTLTKGKISIKIDYSDVGTAKSRTLSADMPDVVIPPSECGDAHCDKEKGEMTATCCMDCGCGKNATGMYCDQKKGCQSVDAVGLTVQGVQPASFEDCAVDHKASLKAMIGSGKTTSSGQSGSGDLTGQITIEPTKQAKAGVPTGLTVDSYELLENGGPSEYASLSCNDVNEVTGGLNCQIDVAPIDECKTAKTIGPLELQVEASWPNGAEETVTRTFTASVQSITVKPTFQAGDGECETNYGESASSSCLDCPCEEDPKFGASYYCDASSKGGTCRPKSAVNLVIDSPKQDVLLDSCSVDNKVKIKAHITNAPGGTSLESASGTLDGEEAKVSCKQTGNSGGNLKTGGLTTTGLAIAVTPTAPSETCVNCGIKPTKGGLDGGSGANVFLDCTLTVPAQKNCDESKTYEHEASLDIQIAYNNGNSAESGMLSAGLPQIFINKETPVPEKEAPQGSETVVGITKQIEVKLKELEALKNAKSQCEGMWDDTSKYGGQYLLYSGTQKTAATVAEKLCSIAERLAAAGSIGPAVKIALCAAIKGTDAYIRTGKETDQTKPDDATKKENFLANPANKAGLTAVLKELRNEIGTASLKLDMGGGNELDFSADVGVLMDQLANNYGIELGALDKATEETKAQTGQSLVAAQKAKCDMYDSQIEKKARDIELEKAQILGIQDCVQNYEKNVAAGNCKEANAIKCEQERLDCENQVKSALKKALGEEQALEEKDKTLEQKYEDALKKAKEGGYAVYETGKGTLFFDTDSDKEPDSLICGAGSSKITVLAACDDGTKPVVKEVAGGAEMPIGGSWQKPASAPPATETTPTLETETPTATTQADGPDLTIATVAVCLTKDNAALKAVGFYVENRGTQSTTAGFTIKYEKAAFPGSFKTDKLDAGTGKWIYPSGTIIGYTDGTGKYHYSTEMKITLDSEGKIAESDESNNIREIALKDGKVTPTDAKVYRGDETCPNNLATKPAEIQISGTAASSQTPSESGSTATTNTAQPSKSFWTLATTANELFSSEGLAEFRLYCNDKLEGAMKGICYCKGDATGCTEKSCPVCKNQIVQEASKQEDTTAGGFNTAKTSTACEEKGGIWDNQKGICKSCNLDANDCPDGKFCGFDKNKFQRCLSEEEVKGLCAQDCKTVYKGSKEYCNYKSQSPACVDCVRDDHCTSVGGGTRKCGTDNKCTRGPDLFIPEGCIWVCLKNGYFDMLGMWVGNGGTGGLTETTQISVKVYRPEANGGLITYAVDRIQTLDPARRTWRYQDMKSDGKAQKIEVVLDSTAQLAETDEKNNNLILTSQGNVVTLEVDGKKTTLPSDQIKSDCANINVRDMADKCPWGTAQGYGT